MAVLKVNSKHNGNSAEKIEKGEFAIEDAATGRDIDLNTNWELCFSPGQRVEMSIVATARLAYRDSFVGQRTLRLMPDPDFHGRILLLKLKFGSYEREEFPINKNVRFRYGDRLGLTSAERRYGQPWAKLEMRKCRFCTWCWGTSEGRKFHESVVRAILPTSMSGFFLGRVNYNTLAMQAAYQV